MPCRSCSTGRAWTTRSPRYSISGPRSPTSSEWQKIVDIIAAPKKQVEIAMVGKYVKLTDSYKSLNEALTHGGIANNCKVNIRYVDSEDLEKDVVRHLSDVDGILVPGGFGSRGIEGKINAVTYARENKIPYFGICLGMQIAVIEVARNIGRLRTAHSTEFHEETDCPVIYLMEEWVDRDERLQTRDEASDKGGTMRLGAYPCKLKPGSNALHGLQPGTDIREAPPSLRVQYALQGAARDSAVWRSRVSRRTETLVEIVELHDHPWFLGCQFHPEFKSKPFKPAPLFREFIRAALKRRQEKAECQKK